MSKPTHPHDTYDMEKVQDALLNGHKKYSLSETVWVWILTVIALILILIGFFK